MTLEIHCRHSGLSCASQLWGEPGGAHGGSPSHSAGLQAVPGVVLFLLHLPQPFLASIVTDLTRSWASAFGVNNGENKNIWNISGRGIDLICVNWACHVVDTGTVTASLRRELSSRGLGTYYQPTLLPCRL